MYLEVVAAIIFYNNKVIVTQRKFSKNSDFSLKYEFPGGKVENDESLLIALKRELKEELEIKVTNIKHFYSYIFSYPDSDVKLNFFTCKTVNLDFRLNVHNSYKIVDIKNLRNLNLLKADYRVIEKLEKHYL